MKVTSDLVAAGSVQPVRPSQPSPRVGSTGAGAPGGGVGASPGVIVDLRSALANLKPGMSYAIGGGYEPVDLSASLAASGHASDKIRDVGVTNFMNAFSSWSKEMSSYWGQVSDFTNKTFGVAGNETATLGGAANDAVRGALASGGVVRPDMPEILKRGGLDDPGAATAVSGTTIGQLSINSLDPGRQTASAVSIVDFDRSVSIPNGQMSIVDLGSGDDTANSVIGTILSSSLKSALSTTEQPAKDGMHRYAITNGKSGAEASVAAVLFTRDADEASVQRAAGLYKTLASLPQA